MNGQEDELCGLTFLIIQQDVQSDKRGESFIVSGASKVDS